jgi:hypothetical protein
MRSFTLLLFIVLGLHAVNAFASGRICTSRDVITFGNQALGTATRQSAVVTNCGDAPWMFTDVSAHAATATAYHVDSTCATGLTLAPAATCRIEVTFAPAVPGQVSGALWLRNSTSTPDQLITFYGRGVDAQAGTATLEFSTPGVDFAAQVVGTMSASIAVTLRNKGSAPFTPRAMVLNGPAAQDFRALGACQIGVPVPAGGACEMNFFFAPGQVGMRTAQFNVDASELANIAMLPLSGLGWSGTVPPVEVVEFYNAPLDHYFLTAVAEEAAAIDRGILGTDWVRTGGSFRAFAADDASVAGALPVCRFFGTPGVGPSAHFYTAAAAECAIVRLNPYWLYEGIAFRALLPVAGACPAGYAAVVRFFRPGAAVLESRHRYVPDPAQLSRMRLTGWIEEGPVFCSPA